MNKLTDAPKIVAFHTAKKGTIDDLTPNATLLDKLNDAIGLTANVQSIHRVIIH
jgi:Zn-dependent alcohol dehydrogenase